MNYYKRHLGDYAKDTRHLSLAEHGAFCLLLDYYYSTEKPIPDDRCERIANAYADSERVAVRAVLREFFIETPEGWRNAKADEVIGEFRAKSLKAKASANSRWEKEQSERNANASKTQCDGNASHKPLATNRETPPSDGPVGIKSFLDSCKAEGVKPIEADDPVWAYADKIGLPDDFVALAWRWFVPAMEGKRKKDWRAHFRNAVKGNWPKYWYADNDGGWSLTTAGKQAQAAMGAK